jgi:sulfatase modifying factor 1
MHRSAPWLALAAALTACRSPTQISVDVETDVPCTQVSATAFTAGELGAIESLPATSASTTCSDGHLGTEVLLPSGASNAAVGFKIVTALNGATTAACSGAAAANDANCIVGRRALRYIPHTPLKVIVDMTQACEGTICTPESTCVNAVCVPATISDSSQCEGAGCNESVLGPADAGVDATVDAGVDATVETGVDGSVDASDAGVGSTDTGAADDSGGEDAGPPCTPGAQQCAGSAVMTCGANGQWGVAWPCATGACSGGACTGATTGSSSPSCAGGGPGLNNCGVDAGDGCCTSLEVPGGTYARTYSNLGGGPTNEMDTATVNGFRLDKYLVTVGRFHQFVNAWDGGAGFEPDPGSGKHTYLNGGRGLIDVGNEDAGVAYEPGWSAADDVNLSPTDGNLACDSSNATWTNTPAGQTLPINCMVWWEAYAFCIWDGGFLPSEAEWEFAAAGGSLMLAYPWGSADPSTAPNQYAIYGEPESDGGHDCFYPSGTLQPCLGGNIAPVGSTTLGVAYWGQLDMGGDVFEWNLDRFEFYVDPCVNCAYLGGTKYYRGVRGGTFNSPSNYLAPSVRYYGTDDGRGPIIGFRCARAP